MILGGGTGGTLMANRLRRRFEPDEAEIHVVDRDDRHVYQPGLLFVPFGLADPRGDRAAAAAPAARRDRLPRERGRPRRARRGPRPSRRTAPSSPTTCWSSRPAPGSLPEETEGLTGAGLERARLHLLHPGGRDRAARGAGALRRRAARREHRRHADQVPGRAARVRVPRRLVPARARHRATAPRSSSATPARRAASRSRSPRSTSPTCSRRRRSSS